MATHSREWLNCPSGLFVHSAKEIRVEPISGKDARSVITRYHYSGKVVNNSQLHLGVFLGGRCLGAMSFGPSLDKRKLQPLVRDTHWNGFVELNRMAFANELPRNSESRALGIAMRLLRKEAGHIQWVVTFADATQCGDGTIYRAAGFVLTSIKPNNQIWTFPGGAVATRMVATDTRRPQRGRLMVGVNAFSRVTATKGVNVLETGGASMKQFVAAGAKPLPGFQLRYVYFLDPTARERLTVPILPFSMIAEMGAGMYRGHPIERAGSIEADAPTFRVGEGGSIPTPALHHSEAVA